MEARSLRQKHLGVLIGVDYIPGLNLGPAVSYRASVLPAAASPRLECRAPCQNVRLRSESGG